MVCNLTFYFLLTHGPSRKYLHLRKGAALLLVPGVKFLRSATAYLLLILPNLLGTPCIIPIHHYLIKSVPTTIPRYIDCWCIRKLCIKCKL